MKILCMNYEYPPIGGGGGTACRGLCEALARNGHEIDIVTSHMRGLPFEEAGDGIRLHRVRCIRRHRHYVTTPELVTQILPAYRRALALVQNGHAVNHTHFIIPSGAASYLLWRRTGLPYVITAHGSDVPGYNPDRFHRQHIVLRPAWKEIIARAACITTPSHFLKRMIQAHIDVPVEIIPHGINPIPVTSPRPKEKRILLVTRMFARKGVQFFLRAAAALDTDWDICIAGDGPFLPRLRELAAEMKRSVRFLGFVTGPRLMELYQSSAIFVFPSIQENYPVVLLEAMNAGCAVITTSAEGCTEVVGDAAIKVRPESVTELRNALDRLLHDEKEIDRLSHLALERAAALSWSQVARTYEEIFARHAR
jgi:glycosyltransferase involved in cell wall biosynthesis